MTTQSASYTKPTSPRITVIGVGGAGSNAVNNMIVSDLEGAEFIVCNTDAQALEQSLADTTIQLGGTITKGLGAGSDPDVGRAAAEESVDEVISKLDGVNMVFITAGMGGGTGTGAAPVIARAVREKGILTVGVVTKPFQFEGAHRMRMAEQGLEKLQEVVDTLIVIPNQNLFRIANQNTTFAQAFELADSVLQSGVRGVTDLIVKNGLINLDFADVRCAMMEMGKAMMGTGEASGERKAIEAAEAAINNPLLDDVSMKGARGVIINITGGYDMTLFDVDEACNRIRDEVDGDANIIFGSTFDDSMEGVMRVSIVATGIDAESVRRTKPFQSGSSVVNPTAVKPSVPADTGSAVAGAAVPVQASAPQSPVSPSQVGDSRPAMPGTQPQRAATSAYAPQTSMPATPAYQETSHSVAGAPPVQATQQYAPVPVSAPSFPPAPAAARPAQQATSAAVATAAEPVVASRPLPQEHFSAPQPITSQDHQASAMEGFMKKPLSLFDRFKSSPEQEQTVDVHTQEAPRAEESVAPNPAPAQEQPQLAIETPQQPDREPKDDLDIPAFLRRQAS